MLLSYLTIRKRSAIWTLDQGVGNNTRSGVYKISSLFLKWLENGRIWNHLFTPPLGWYFAMGAWGRSYDSSVVEIAYHVVMLYMFRLLLVHFREVGWEGVNRIKPRANLICEKKIRFHEIELIPNSRRRRKPGMPVLDPRLIVNFILLLWLKQIVLFWSHIFLRVFIKTISPPTLSIAEHKVYI